MGIINLGPIRYGDTHIHEFVCEEPDGTRPNLTGCTIRWGWAARSAPTIPLGTATLESDNPTLRVIDADDGVVALFMSPATIAIGNYVHELEVNFPTGDTYTYATGRLTIGAALYPSTYPA